jgi:spermidine/putrescine transport system substrate-binding protein
MSNKPTIGGTISHSGVPATPAAFAILALAFLGLSGCGKARPSLSVYTWADYIKPDLVKRFEAEHGCRVVIDTFESNEAMYAKLKAGASGYDVLTPTSYMVDVMNSQGMLLGLDHERLPNLVHVDPEFLKLAIDKTMSHSVPYMQVVSGVAYFEGRVEDVRPTWAVFDRADLRGRMTMFNDMRETIGAALKFLGHSINTTDPGELDEALVVLLRWKKNLAKFDSEQYKNGLASGEFLVAHAWNGDILQVEREVPEVRFVVPAEGTIIGFDDLVILKGAVNVDLAHAFINFLHEPQVAAANTEFIRYLCPNRASYSFLGPAIRDNPAIFVAPEILAKSETIANLGEANALYVKTWDRLKSGE